MLAARQGQPEARRRCQAKACAQAPACESLMQQVPSPPARDPIPNLQSGANRHLLLRKGSLPRPHVLQDMMRGLVSMSCISQVGKICCARPQL